MENADIWQLKEELESITLPENLSDLSYEEIEKWHNFIEKRKEFRKYNKLAYWKPYPFQEEWIAASKTYRQRYLSAGNRLGKLTALAMNWLFTLQGCTLIGGWVSA